MKLLTAVVFGSVFLFLGVLFGALGSHALQTKLSEDSLASYMIATRYLFYHGLGLLLLSSLPFVSEQIKERIALFLVVGTLVFSMSIIVLSTKSIHGLTVSFLGPVTPLGGIMLLAGWGYLAFELIRS
ncbi:MAG: DUF423 domain-containing protein [Flavobacteriaceae bacterium]